MHSAPCFRGTRRQSHPGRGAQQMAKLLLEAFAQLQRREPEIEARQERRVPEPNHRNNSGSAGPPPPIIDRIFTGAPPNLDGVIPPIALHWRPGRI